MKKSLMIDKSKKKQQIITLEEMSLNAWPALQTINYQGSLLRFANGYTKRANSVNALYHYGEISNLIDYAERMYQKNKLPVIFKIIGLPDYTILDTILESKNYQVLDEVTVNINSFGENQFTFHNEVRIEKYFSTEWITSYIEANHLEAKSDTVRQLLLNIIVDKFVASLKIDNKMIGFGFGAIENGFIGFFDIFIVKEYRGKGYGKKLMESLLYHAKQNGIEHGYLQVMDNNLIANQLYHKLGFTPNYKYWYRIKVAT